jgi:hypothetical protein
MYSLNTNKGYIVYLYYIFQEQFFLAYKTTKVRRLSQGLEVVNIHTIKFIQRMNSLNTYITFFKNSFFWRTKLKVPRLSQGLEVVR